MNEIVSRDVKVLLKLGNCRPPFAAGIVALPAYSIAFCSVRCMRCFFKETSRAECLQSNTDTYSAHYKHTIALSSAVTLRGLLCIFLSPHARKGFTFNAATPHHGRRKRASVDKIRRSAQNRFVCVTMGRLRYAWANLK